MSFLLTGLGASRGTVVGRVYIRRYTAYAVVEQHLDESLIAHELERLDYANKVVRQQLNNILDKVPDSTSSDISSFINSHLLMLEDHSFKEVPGMIVQERLCNAEWALKVHGDALLEAFNAMDDPYIKTRQDDVVYLIDHLQRVLSGQKDPAHEEKPDDGLNGCIVITDQISPSELLLLSQQGVAGVVTERGGLASHASILARSLGIPTIVGAHSATSLLKPGETVAMDGKTGIVVASLDETALDVFSVLKESESEHYHRLNKMRDWPSVTMDGHPVSLLANIDVQENVSKVSDACASGIGLYRTEWLFLNSRSIPDEDAQFEAYLDTVNALEGKPVTIRTFDLGADKPTLKNTEKETNPALGERAIRLYRSEPDYLLPQLRAIARASAYGPVKILVPMVSCLQEIKWFQHKLLEAKNTLRRRGQPYNEEIPLGLMIETPSVALMLEGFVDYVDFFSIGTNDLIQYTLAVDRLNDALAYLYDPTHPAILRLIYNIIQVGENAGVPVSVCGEMAGDDSLTRLLLGMGLREFSLQSGQILEVKNIVRSSHISTLEPLVEKLLKSTEKSEIEAILDELNES